ncbi:MAG TPA: sialidase family protein [Acidimicrobiales bacterium]|nr:sialidase family protein [Acidimicrobiales bacterium]
MLLRSTLFKRTRPMVLLCVLMALVMPLALRAVSPTSRVTLSSTSLPPGCLGDPEQGFTYTSPREASAFYSNGSAAPSAGAPYVCANNTNYGGAESTVQVAPNGDVVEEPAMTAPGLLGTGAVADAPGTVPTGTPAGSATVPRDDWAFASTSGLVVSKDGGKDSSWQFTRPAGQEHDCCDTALYIDRKTGTLYYSSIFDTPPAPLDQAEPITLPAAEIEAATYDANGATDYTNWTAPSTMYGMVSENPRFTSASVPAGGAPAVAGQDVTYWCGNGPGRQTRECYRTLDGGQTWEFASILDSPLTGQCASGSAPNFAYPVGGPQGAVYDLVSCGSTATYLARSTDEGTTWPLVTNAKGNPVVVPGSPTEIRVDSAGNIYAFQLDGTAIEVEISRNGGQTWSPWYNMTAPAARGESVFQWQVSVGYVSGQVTAAYFVKKSSAGGTSVPGGLGSASGNPGGWYDAYLTTSHDAVGANPVFYAATVNPPNLPLMTAGDPGAGDDWLWSDMGPDGSGWGSFYSACEQSASGVYLDPACAAAAQFSTAPLGSPDNPVEAETVGRLWFPSSK